MDVVSETICEVLGSKRVLFSAILSKWAVSLKAVVGKYVQFSVNVQISLRVLNFAGPRRFRNFTTQIMRDEDDCIKAGNICVGESIVA